MKILATMDRDFRMMPQGNGPAWLPLAGFTTIACAASPLLPPWGAMWCIAVAIYAGCKWLTAWNALQAGADTTLLRFCQYLFLWPGMDAARFLNCGRHVEKPGTGEWISGVANTAFGAFLLWGVARRMENPLFAGWIGMTGIVFLLHFGTFKLIANYWRQNGVCAQPLMRMPLAAESVGDFWGRRWNSAFRDLAFGLMFRRFKKTFHARTALILTFIVSGMIHDLIISFPARGGYGLPAAYFTLQGAAILAEHSLKGLRGNWRGRIFALAIISLPALVLFHPPFVLRVVVPFMHAIQAL